MTKQRKHNIKKIESKNIGSRKWSVSVETAGNKPKVKRKLNVIKIKLPKEGNRKKNKSKKGDELETFQ